MNNEDYCFCELAPLYALDLLNEQERTWVEQQAAASPELAAELAELQVAVGAIPYGAPVAPLAPDLKDRLFQRLSQMPSDPPAVSSSNSIVELEQRRNQETAQSAQQTEFQTVDRSTPRANRRANSWLRVGSAIAALTIFALLVDNYRLRQTTQTSKGVIEALRQSNTVTYPLRGTEQAASASGSLVVDPSQNTVVVLAQNLPELPSEQAYRLWAIPKGGSKPAYCGQFNSGSQGVTARWSPPNAACTATSQILITAESATAPPVPAGPLVMKSAL